MAKLFHQSQSPGEDLARTTLLVTGITIISRLLGFGRDVLIAYTLGGGAQADVFVAVFRIPNFVRRLSAEGCISMPFIPEYFRRLRQGNANTTTPANSPDLPSNTNEACKLNGGKEEIHNPKNNNENSDNYENAEPNANKPDNAGHISYNPAKASTPQSYSPQAEEEAMLFARSAMLWVVLICLPLCALGIFFPHQTILFVAPGFALKPEEMDASATLLRLLLPYALILCTIAIGSSILQGRGRFVAPAIIPCIPNITVLAVMIGAILLGNINLYPQATGEPAHAALLFCQALLFSSILQWLYMGSIMRREKLNQKNLRWFGALSLKPAQKFIKKIPISLCGTASHQVNILITGMGASLLAEGAVAQFHYADQLISLPLGLFGIAIGIISLPSLTDLAAQGKLVQLRATLAQGMGLGLFLSLPAAAGLAGIAQPLVQILFERGAFDASASRGTALALAGASLCLPALAISRPLLAACHAKGYIHLAAICGIISMIITGLASLALPALLLANQLSLLGIGLAVSFGAWVFTIVLWLCLSKRQLAPSLRQFRPYLAPFCFCLLIFIVCRCLINFLPHKPYLCIGLLVPFCMISYFAFSKLFNCKEATIILNSLKTPPASKKIKD